MSMLDAARIALLAIAANRMRSGLTALGMIIGVSSVIVLIAVGQGTQKGVTDQIRSLGTDLIFVQPGVGEASPGETTGGFGSAATLVLGDAEAIVEANIAGVAGVVPHFTIDTQAIAGARNQGVPLVGTTSEYVFVRDADLAAGTFLTPFDEASDEMVIVLGARVAETLLPEQDPVGQDIRLSFAGGRITLEFTVVGVMAERGGSDGGGLDDQVFAPLTSLSSRFRFLRRQGTGDLVVNEIDIRTTPDADQEAVKQQITELISFRHSGEQDFVVQSQDDLIGAASQVSNTLSLLLGSIAGISLLVGGIGVMNIMLVSVTERTREIGIRRAVGAQAGDIVKQFVTEALALSLAGGLAGIGLGVAASMFLGGSEIAGQQMTTVIQPWSIAVAFAVAAIVGLVSGSYPAYRATTVDPIAALRNE